jgi:hypothetical protein
MNTLRGIFSRSSRKRNTQRRHIVDSPRRDTPDGAGIVLDDAMAGVYAALVLWAAGWFNSISAFLYGPT